MAERKREVDRRTVLKAGLGVTAAAAAAGSIPAALGSLGGASAAPAPTTGRAPGSLPYPTRPAGTKTNEFPFDHIVIVMQENHSFDNYFGMLPLRGQPLADGFTFDAHGRPTNATPVPGGGREVVFHMPDFAGVVDTGSQNWNDTHRQINGGAMDGFAATGPGSMGYWDEPDLPFYYSLATTFTLANRWFCSAPCQTYPNRRFLMAGTASGIISTDLGNVTKDYPAAGTIWDQLSTHGISWRNYFTDAPSTAILFDTVLKHPLNLSHIEQFYLDASLGTLPSVSLVDCSFGAISGEIGGELTSVKVPLFSSVGGVVNTTAESEENPQDIQLGESFVARVVNAVMHGPAWKRTLLVWLYDEHGGYYDHVPPPAAIAPDAIPPMLTAGDAPGGYDLYGPRVPAVVVSPYARPHAVTDVVHDHTSVLATIEHQWNLPALTYRDANATTLMDFLDPSTMSFPTPPRLAAPANPLPGLLNIYAHGQGTPPPPTP